MVFLDAVDRSYAGDLRSGLSLVAENEDLLASVRQLRYTSGALLSWFDPVQSLGDLEGALADDEEIQHFSDMVGYDTRLNYIFFRAYALMWLGRLREARAEFDDIGALARERDFVEAALYSDIALVVLYESTRDGDVSTVLSRALRSVTEAEQLGSREILVTAYSSLGCIHLLSESWNDAIAALNHGLAMGRENSSFLLLDGQMLAYLARAQAGLGDVDAARTTAEEAVLRARETGARVYEIAAYLAYAHVLLRATGAPDEIERELDHASALVEETGARVFAPRICAQRADLAQQLGDTAGRERHLREAHRLYTEMGATGHAERLARELGLADQ